MFSFSSQNYVVGDSKCTALEVQTSNFELVVQSAVPALCHKVFGILQCNIRLALCT